MCAGVAVSCAFPIVSARADSCSKSRDYILEGSVELRHPARVYRQLYTSCLQTLQMPNVKDAFVLAAGAVAVLPHNDSVPATAGTLAQFCTRFPKATLRFIGRREVPLTRSLSQIVQLGTSQSTPCQKITGNG